MKKLTLSNGGYCIVDEDKFDFLNQWSWHIGKTNYVIRNCDLKKMHRLVLSAEKGQIVDHINGIKNDNRIENLRFVDTFQNVHNHPKYKSIINQYKGTRYRKKDNTWEGRCRMFKQDFYLGVFETELAAGWAYEKKAREISPTYRRQSFPLSDEEMDKLMEAQRKIVKSAIKKSKYKHIYWNKRSNNWSVIISIKAKRYNLGYYLTEDAAYIALEKFLKDIENKT